MCETYIGMEWMRKSSINSADRICIIIIIVVTVKVRLHSEMTSTFFFRTNSYSSSTVDRNNKIIYARKIDVWGRLCVVSIIMCIIILLLSAKTRVSCRKKLTKNQFADFTEAIDRVPQGSKQMTIIWPTSIWSCWTQLVCHGNHLAATIRRRTWCALNDVPHQWRMSRTVF